MKKYSLMLFLVCSLYNGYSQQMASVAISLQRIKNINVEKNNFFEQPYNYSLQRPSDDELRIQFNKGYQLPASSSFNVSKIDDYHYLLKYQSDKPGMLYLNYKPIYITPGDSVHLTYKMTGEDMNTLHDSIFANGVNSSNYTFSNHRLNRALLKYRPDIKNAKYNQDAQLFYNDLTKFYQINDAFFDSLFAKKGCAAPLIDYLRRKRKVDLFFELFYYEQQLQDSNSPQVGKLSGLIETSFEKNTFKPADTAFSFVTENLFKGYFKRLVNVKFNQLKSRNDFDNLYNYAKNYTDPFVKQYFLYFFAMNYNKVPQNLHALEVDALVEQSDNPGISKAFKDRI